MLEKTKLGYVGNMSEISISVDEIWLNVDEIWFTMDGLWSNTDDFSLLWMKQEEGGVFKG